MLRNTEDVSDGELLRCFASSRDEAAFAELVRRHGPMVLRVCQRILPNSADAEDAFQAVFIVLTRKVASLVNRQQVAGWLYGVACHVARDARRRVSKRQAKERPVEVELFAPAAREAMLDQADWRTVLDEELQRLPPRYREPVVLCYLEGKTNNEAAQKLGCSRGMVAWSLSQARSRLRGRLAHRGLTVTAGGLMAWLVQEGASAAKFDLMSSTIQSATQAAAEGATVHGTSALADSATRTLAAPRVRGPFLLLRLFGVLTLLISAGLAVYMIPAPAEPTLPRRWNFNAPELPEDIRLLSGSWRYLATDGPDGSGCMGRGLTGGVQVLLDVDLSRLPVLVEYQCLPESSANRPSDATFRLLSWDRHTGFADFYEAGGRNFPSSQWQQVRVYVTEDALDYWIGPQRVYFRAGQRHAGARLTLQFPLFAARIDNLSIRSIKAQEVPSAAEYFNALARMPIEQRVDTTIMPELRSHAGRGIRIKFYPASSPGEVEPPDASAGE